MDWWSIGVFQQILQYYTHFSPRLHVLVCTDMVSSKELERDVTTNAMAKEPPRLKTLELFLHMYMIDSIFLRPKDE